MEIEPEAAGTINSFQIKATNVPREFFENRDVAKRYFRRFGKVKLVMFKPKRNCLLIEYANEDGMLNALEIAGEYNGQLFNVSRDFQHITKKKKSKKEVDPDWTDDPDIQAELEAMGAFRQRTAYNFRAEPMAVDTPETSKQRRWKGAPTSSPLQKKKTVVAKEEQNDLKQIIKQQALTTEDKYRILDARDKLIRIKMKKNIELSNARATVGTCPDMCPEKERLMRETQHQVALYEQDESGKNIMNPKVAVKQYSRSSADQEAPLPQELRPVSVLQMTMGYLMHQIMGLCDTPDVNITEWYHFLWDRTRGIRKDITQQELCCQGSVELVEQCARFHIFCSARLVAEDPSVFDQKINTENLTKCLQTLKYMYHDLELKGESCRNEAEFRAYIILLNLNDGNFMWEVQQLRPSIQLSNEVKFALDVYSSLDKHNYVKFFKLVNSTSFLNACVLMRYFIQVRISALKTFLKSYSPRVSQTSLPVQYLTNILGFEGTESTIDFFETYGLFTNVERTRIVLSKQSFSAPEFPYILDRAIRLVESKRDKSTGEIVCGRELPPKLYEVHVPQNSFDANGYLKFAPDEDEVDSVRKVEDKPRFISSPITIKVSEPQDVLKPKATPRSLFEPKTTPQSLFTVKPKDMPLIFNTPMPSSVFAPSTQKNIFGQVESVVPTQNQSFWGKSSNIFGQVGNGLAMDIVPLAPPAQIEAREEEDERKRIEEEERSRKEEQKRNEEKRRKEEERRRRKLEEEEKERKRLELQKKLLEEEVERNRLEEERQLAAMRKKLIEEQQKRKEQERRKNVEIKAAVSNVISSLLDEVEEHMKQTKLAEIARRIHERKIKKVIKKWRENTRRKRKRKALDFNPVWFTSKSVQEEAQELRMPNQYLALQNMKRYKRGKPFEVLINEDEDIAKIDLCELTYKLLKTKFLEVEKKLRIELFWKVTVSLPNVSEFTGLSHIERVLDRYINWEKKGAIIEQSRSLPTITYCLEKQKGLVVNPRNDTNGFIFVSNDFTEDLCTRITQNFRNYGRFVKVPIVLVLQTYTEHKARLQGLISTGIISDYLILVDKFTSKNLINLVEEALIFLATRVDKPPPLEMDTLKSFLLEYLCSNVWKRANSFSKWNSNYKECLKNPNTVIYLYNEALERIKKILLDQTCKEYPRFPGIFKEFLRSDIPNSLPCDYKYFPSFWDNPSYIKHVEKVLNELRFPNFLENWPSASQSELEISVMGYCSQISKNPQRCFYKTMSIVLRNLEPDVNFQDVKHVMWTEIIELLATEKVNEMDFSLYGTGFVNKSVYNQLIVVYDANALTEFVRSDWFYVSHPVVKPKVEELLGNVETKPRYVEVEEEVDLDAILEKIQKPKKFDVGIVKNEMSSCRKMLADLEDTVGIHKRILEKSGQILKTIMEEN